MYRSGVTKHVLNPSVRIASSTEDRRYASGPLPPNNSQNAGQWQRRMGMDKVAGFETEKEIDGAIQIARMPFDPAIGPDGPLESLHGAGAARTSSLRLMPVEGGFADGAKALLYSPHAHDMVDNSAHLDLGADWPARGMVNEFNLNLAGADVEKDMTGYMKGKRLVGQYSKGNVTKAFFDATAAFDDGIPSESSNWVENVFTGVVVDPLTGVEYDTYESAAPPPVKDTFVHDKYAARRAFSFLNGGHAPDGNTYLHKREELNEDPDVPDVPTIDPVEFARNRAYEYAVRQDMFASHVGEYASTDADGYAGQATDGLKFGDTFAPRMPVRPDFSIHRDRQLYGLRGNGVDSALPQGDVRVDPKIAYQKLLADRKAIQRLGGVDGTAYASPFAVTAETVQDLKALQETLKRFTVSEGFLSAPSLDHDGAIASLNPDAARDPVRVGNVLNAMSALGLEQEQYGLTQAGQAVASMVVQRDDMSAALGQALMTFIVQAEHAATAGTELPAEIRQALRTSSETNYNQLVHSVIDSGLLQGPIVLEDTLIDPDHLPMRADAAALALGDIALASLDATHFENGPLRAMEYATQTERDALSISLGRILMNLNRAADFEQALTSRDTQASDAMRVASSESAELVQSTLGSLAAQVLEDGLSAGYDGTALYSKIQSIRNDEDCANALGRVIRGVVSQVEAMVDMSSDATARTQKGRATFHGPAFMAYGSGLTEDQGGAAAGGASLRLAEFEKRIRAAHEFAVQFRPGSNQVFGDSTGMPLYFEEYFADRENLSMARRGMTSNLFDALRGITNDVGGFQTRDAEQGSWSHGAGTRTPSENTRIPVSEYDIVGSGATLVMRDSHYKSEKYEDDGVDC